MKWKRIELVLFLLAEVGGFAEQLLLILSLPVEEGYMISCELFTRQGCPGELAGRSVLLRDLFTLYSDQLNTAEFLTL